MNEVLTFIGGVAVGVLIMVGISIYIAMKDKED